MGLSAGPEFGLFVLYRNEKYGALSMGRSSMAPGIGFYPGAPNLHAIGS